MTGISIKLSEATLERLRTQARATGRSIAALVRECVESPSDQPRDGSVYALSADLAGSLAGPRRSASNERRRFRRW